MPFYSVLWELLSNATWTPPRAEGTVLFDVMFWEVPRESGKPGGPGKPFPHIGGPGDPSKILGAPVATSPSEPPFWNGLPVGPPPKLGLGFGLCVNAVGFKVNWGTVYVG